MTKQTKLIEYHIIDSFNECIDVLPTRAMARDTKRLLKDDFNERVKIVQKIYELKTTKEIR